MKWKYKALLQLAFSNMPLSEGLNYFFQRHVTKSLPVTDAKFIEIVSAAKEHIDIIKRYCHSPLDNSTFYEFGAGWDMIIPLAFYAFGVQHQIITDINNLLKPALLNDSVEKYQRIILNFVLPRKPHTHIDSKGHDFIPLLAKSYGIDYRAPCDAQHTEIGSCSIDYITSTNTLEHIPLHDIQEILKECHRILRDDGIMSFQIDYQDHYSYFDQKLSVYNFLQYSEKSWAWFSSTLNYQNRLRHRDYMNLFEESGFEIVEERRKDGTASDLKTISRLPLDKKYSTYSLSDLAVRGAFVALRKRL
jgi:hypothetical protein